MKTTDSSLLSALADLDPTAHQPLASPAVTDATRQWVLDHDRPAASVPAGAGASAPVRAPQVRRRLVLAGAAALVVAGGVGVLPALAPGGGSSPQAAAIPMLDYAQPEGADSTAALDQLARQLDAAPPTDTGPLFFEHRYYFGYSMQEVQTAEEVWEVVALDPRESDEYSWTDTGDGSGGHLITMDGTPDSEHVFGPGELAPISLESPGSPEAIYASIVAGNESHEAAPGYYLLDDYAARANKLTPDERSNFLRALALSEDITSYGAVTDRAGRSGIGLAATRTLTDATETRQTELVLVLDPATGEVLEVDDVYPNTLPGAPALVESYALYITSGYTDTLPLCGTRECPGTNNPA